MPHADGTLVRAPPNINDELLIMMSDIFPTGYYGAMRAVSHFETEASGKLSRSDALRMAKQPLKSAVFVCLGCGIVGLCAIMTAVLKGAGTVFCVDSVPDRLEQAQRMGGIALRLGVDDVQDVVLKATDGRGADAVIENVGNQPALKMAMELLRPCGVLSSVGFHQSEMPFTALQGYQKNVKYVSPEPVSGSLDANLTVLTWGGRLSRQYLRRRWSFSHLARTCLWTSFHIGCRWPRQRGGMSCSNRRRLEKCCYRCRTSGISCQSYVGITLHHQYNQI